MSNDSDMGSAGMRPSLTEIIRQALDTLCRVGHYEQELKSFQSDLAAAFASANDGDLEAGRREGPDSDVSTSPSIKSVRRLAE